jgi:tetratricopeptide (TPR) repeat protein
MAFGDSVVITKRNLVRFAVVMLVLGLLAPQAWAWYQFRAACDALAKYHTTEARVSLNSCERVWGSRPAIHLLASRAARQDDDLEAAATELRSAQRLVGGASDESAFEWALLQAAWGNVREVEEYLQKRAEQSPGQVGPLVWEALAMGYLRKYRTLDAMACLNHWLKQEPKNVRALELRGRTYAMGRGIERASEDYRRVLELDPSRARTRWLLIDALLATGTFDEATTNLEIFAKEKPDDPAIASRLAKCFAMNRRVEEGSRLIDAALAKHPDDGPCLRTRGQLYLIEERPAEAEAALRKAVALMPSDYQTQQLLFRSLQQQPGKIEEAKAQLKIAEDVRERSEQIAELTSRKLAEFPLDPAVHYAMGKLMMQSGRGDAGEGWLLTALELDPNFKPAHAELAAYYERIGEQALAAEHRKKAAP